MDFDVVIRNGTVVDGSGLAPYRADVGIRNGRIARIGRIRDKGREEIDAEGHVVTPGFIDGHTHMDAQLFWDELGTNSCWHGVSTVVMGNCGFTLAPAHPERRELVVRNLERAEDISPAALAAGVEWSWERFGGYLDAVDRAPKAINYAANIGHSALRTWAMGERAFEEQANEDDLAMMEGELREALQAGAIGFTTSRSDQHETSDNRPVASRLASWDEVRRLVNAMGETGAGVFQLTNEPTPPEDPEGAAEYRGRLGSLALEAGVPVTFGVSGAAYGRDMLQLIDDTSAAGGRMFGLSHSRGITVMLSFKTRLPMDVIPEWKEVRSLPQDAQIRALRDPDVRKKLVYAAHHGDYGHPIGAEARKPDYDAMRVFERPIPPTPTVAEVAAQRGMDPVELMIDMAVESNFEQFFAQPLGRQSDDRTADLVEEPPGGHDVLRFGRPRQPDPRLLDPDPPPRPLGPRPAGLLPRGGDPHDHPGPGHGLGVPRPRAAARGPGRRHQRARPRFGGTADADARIRPPRRRPPPRSEGVGLSRHHGRRRGHPALGGADGGTSRAAAAGAAGGGIARAARILPRSIGNHEGRSRV